MAPLRTIDVYVAIAVTLGFVLLKPARAILYQGLVPVPTYTPATALPLPLLDAFNQQQQHLVHANVLNDFDTTIESVKNANTFSTSPLNSAIFYSNVGSVSVKPTNDFFSNELDTYFHNGRYLKQYLVMEENLDDTNALNEYLSRFVPYVPSNYNIQTAVRRPTVGYSPSQGNNFFSVSPPRHTPLPIQLGSGSLGYLRLPNGAVYLGSGSLGYTNDQQKAIDLANVRNRQSPGAGPLTFGETPR